MQPSAIASSFQPLAPSLDVFFGTKLLAKGETSPLMKLEDAVDRADAKLEAGKPKQALELLKEALAPYQKMPDPKRENVEDNEDARSDVAFASWALPRTNAATTTSRSAHTRSVRRSSSSRAAATS